MILKKHIKSIEFFKEYHDVIIDQVCDCVEAVTYQYEDVIMDKGEAADFMIIVYSGFIGIYFATVAAMSSGEVPKNCIVKLTKGAVLGDKGLLLQAPWGATVIAETQVQALYLSLESYKKVVENFQKSLIFQNINLINLIWPLEKISFDWKERMAKTFMTKILKKGQTAIKIGDEASMVYFVKQGSLSVTKRVQVPENNYWPVSNKSSKCRIKQTIQKKYMKEIFNILPKQYFGLNEITREVKFSCELTAL